MAMFNGANNVVVQGGSFVANAGSPPKRDLKKLLAEVAPNAILNAGGRADEVRCFPGTREEVIGKLEEFMDDNSPDRKRMMWLSGPAGAGKSAIFQTVAERCGEQERQAANFFFYRGDSTRSHSKPLVATLVYQLRCFYPALNELLSDYLVEDPLIGSAPIEKQFKQLISSPIEKIQQSTPIQERTVIIIDGLDECNNKTRDQDQILIALHALAHADDSPFLVLVSSRAEPQLVMSFNRLGISVESIFLNEDYQPEKDIRLFVVKKFAEIKRHHHLARTLGEKWPTAADIDAIIKKSSGQFIYAATVLQFIQFSSSSPALSLVIILEMSLSVDHNHNPLAHLDAVYSYIFSKAHNIWAVKLILFARYCTRSHYHSQYFVPALRVVGYDDIKVESYFADLVAIIKVVPGTHALLEFYHASLDDYLNDKSRSTIYCVNENELAAEFSSMCLSNFHNADSIKVIVDSLSCVQKPTPELSKSLLAASTVYIDHTNILDYLGDLIAQIERVYWEHDKDQFKVLLQSWSRFVYINSLEKDYYTGVEARNPSASRYYEQYWTTPYNNVTTRTEMVEWGGPAPGPAHSHASRSVFSELFDSLRNKFRRRQPRGTSRPINIHEEEQEYESREYNDSPHKSGMIRMKFHYRGDIRSMTLAPNTPFSEFTIKVTTKFGMDFDDLTMKFKDKHGDKITIRDDSDYEHAIETARQSSKGRVEGLLEIWCQDRV